jgi:copper(I)-binding protein
MNRRLIGVGAVLVLLAGCGGTKATGPSVVVVTDAQVRPAITSSDTQRAVITVTMTSSADDELIGAQVPATVAGKVTVEGVVGSAGHFGHLDAPGAPPHTHTTIDRIKVPKGVALQLKAGVGRILLDQIVQPIRNGDQFPLTLTFATGAAQTVTVTAKAETSNGGAQQFGVTVGGTQPTVGTVAKDTLVAITVSNPNADDEFHLHGYDLTEKAARGTTATFTFVATDPGTFPMESHTTNTNLFTLTVLPA